MSISVSLCRLLTVIQGAVGHLLSIASGLQSTSDEGQRLANGLNHIITPIIMRMITQRVGSAVGGQWLAHGHNHIIIPIIMQMITERVGAAVGGQWTRGDKGADENRRAEH
jgi:hypothetical protein